MDDQAEVAFIGPCISKKLEARRPEVAETIDYVITYEELMGMFLSKDIDPAEIKVDEEWQDASETGRNYAVSGGVAEAVKRRIVEINPDLDVKVEKAEGLADCVKLAQMAKLGRKDGLLLEGMACVGGCVGGPGTLISELKTGKAVKQFAKESIYKSPYDNKNIPDEDKPKD